ncbi:MAG: epoxyqueuosine reductase QueH [Eubacteriales bacterium]|nr:epoxyqueuosine reductase QueH [Eubacteriales bacterium]
MNKRNYQHELEQLIKKHEAAGETPRLLIHACCAPCSSYVMEYLSRYFLIDFYYYNPNIDTAREYAYREEELKRLAASMPMVHPAGVIAEDYDPEHFYEIARGHEKDPERGERCLRCYELRLRKTAEYVKRTNENIPAGEKPYSYFTTTLSISPMKDAAALNGIGERIAAEYGLRYLPSDFKKKGGYLRSTELSREYGLYRQDYCGCVFSRRKNETNGSEASQ